VRVTGTITLDGNPLDGNPLDGAIVKFISKDGTIAAGKAVF
jgi:hypothetical protein